MLGETSKGRDEASKSLVKIYIHKGTILPCIISILKYEVEHSSKLLILSKESKETLFRANSMGSKIVDNYMKETISPCLETVLKPILDEIFASKPNCEVIHSSSVVGS